MFGINNKYKYFHVKDDKVIGFIESSFKLDNPSFIPVTDKNKQYFMRQDVLLGVKDGKIVELKENG